MLFQKSLIRAMLRYRVLKRKTVENSLTECKFNSNNLIDDEWKFDGRAKTLFSTSCDNFKADKLFNASKTFTNTRDAL